MRILNRISNRVPNRIVNRPLYGLHGVDSLNSSLTINSTTVTPVARYKGGDADGTNWDNWDYGQTLTYQAGTAPNYNQGPPPGYVDWDTDTDSIYLNQGAWYKAASTSTGNISSNLDFVVEAVLVCDDTNNGRIFGKRDAGNNGWEIQFTSTPSVRLTIEGAGASRFKSTDTLSLGQYYHYIAFGNRDENSADGFRHYINGADATGAGYNISTAGDADNTAVICIGARDAGGNAIERNIAYLAFWSQAAWHQAGSAGPAEWDGIALARSNAFWGV